MLHPHQHERLVEELRRTEYDGLTADGARAAIRAAATAWAEEKARREPSVKHSLESALASDPEYLPTPRHLLTVSFCSQSRFDRVRPKMRRGMVPLPDDYAAKFPGGVPGMPGKIRPDEFAAAWAEARKAGA